MTHLRIVLAATVMLYGVSLLASPDAVSAASSPLSMVASAADEAQSGVDAVNSGNDTSLEDMITSVINVLLYIAGIIAVIMIIVGGIKYMTSSGDSSGISSAKNTVLYAIIGLVLVILAFAIVNWVVKAFTP
jgi:type IV secretory pathway VirB2 component (pilin)